MGAGPTLLQTVAKRLKFEINFMVSRTAFLGALNMVYIVKPCCPKLLAKELLFILSVKQQRHGPNSCTPSVLI